MSLSSSGSRSSRPSGRRGSSTALRVTWKFLSGLRMQVEGSAVDLDGAEALRRQVREGVVEGRERVRAGDVEHELFVELRVDHDDLHAVGRLAPEEANLD